MSARRRTALGAAVAAAAVLAASAAAAVSFGRADRNNDGVLDYPEVARAFPNITEAQFHRMDINRDGVIDKHEFPQLDAIYQLLIKE